MRLVILVSALSFAAGSALVQTVARAIDISAGDDVIATVGDQYIRFSQLTKELDQGAVVGISLPGYGTPERKQILMRLLDDAIRNRLLYLDALRNGVVRDPAYQEELQRFEDGLLAGLFRERQMQSGQRESNDLLRQQWREGIPIRIDEYALDPARDTTREDDDVLATVGDAKITWGDASPRLLVATRRAALADGAVDAEAERLEVLNQMIDFSAMALRARQAGLERDPVYLQRLADFKKTAPASFRYRQLAEEMSPTNDEIEVYARQHAETSAEIDGRSMRTTKRVIIKQRIDKYLDGLPREGLHVMVDEGKLDRLFLLEAQQQATRGEGLPKY